MPGRPPIAQHVSPLLLLPPLSSSLRSRSSEFANDERDFCPTAPLLTQGESVPPPAPLLLGEGQRSASCARWGVAGGRA
ncbi:hypothetical protein CALVIDRAFT_538659 [Calocera viscosa TUFC12733]|uniref:Uncharacterized protein n=1 Tax=Calocera viscosa (strain TUFC12733) TaxID=1330018 RepID=A0A167KQH1_CALVF|nr:hypothetical protein CALVIDRAFT_538659 [Calocera viscosa TUFC12733]